MNSKASITVVRPREEVERLWRDPSVGPGEVAGADVQVRFADAPGDHGTEIHVEVRSTAPAGKLGQAIQRATARAPLPKVKDAMRHFKQRVETGVIAQSDAVPEGERVERKLHERPAQPLSESELTKVGA